MSVSQEAVKPSRRMGAGAKIAIGTIGTLAALTFGLNAVIEKRNELPEMSFADPPQPNPNAYLYFMAAGNAIQNDSRIDDMISNRPRPEPGLPRPGPAGIPYKIVSRKKKGVYTLAEKEKFLAENQQALATLRSGFAYAYSNKPLHSASDSLIEFSKFRSLARLLLLESQVKAAHGDWNGAVNSDLNAIELGVTVPRNGVLVASLVGIACEEIGRRPLWDDYKHLDAAQSLAALKRLIKIEAKRFSYADTMEAEKRFGQIGLREEFHSAAGVPANQTADTDEAGNSKETFLQRWAWKMRVKWVGSRAILENHDKYMEQIIQDSRKPYGLHLPPPPAPPDPVNAQIAGVYDVARTRLAAAETQNRLLAVSLAIQIYREANGAYPPSLDALKDTLSADMKTDPFAVQGDLRYRLDGAKYVLYSVGPDGKDDNGTPIYDKTKSADNNARARYFVQADSAGDIVAGVNR